MKTEQINTWQHFIIGLAFIGTAFWSNIEIPNHVIFPSLISGMAIVKIITTGIISILIGSITSLFVYCSITALCSVGKTVENNLTSFSLYVQGQKGSSLILKIFGLSFLIVVFLFFAKVV